MSLANIFHEALTKVHDRVKNMPWDQRAKQDILEIVDAALAEGRRHDCCTAVGDRTEPTTTAAEA